MIFVQTVSEAMAKLMEWAEKNHITNEARKVLQDVCYTLARRQLHGGTLPEEGTQVRTFVREILAVADGYGYGEQAEQALRDVGYGEHIPPKSGEFNVSFAGVTLRLTLPISRWGNPHGVHGAVDRAVEDAVITPVTAEVSGDVMPEGDAAA